VTRLANPLTRRTGGTTLVARLDSMGDVLLSGPAVRAIADQSSRVVYLCSPIGRPAVELLPGVDDIIEFAAPWVLADPPPVRSQRMLALIDDVRSRSVNQAVILTSSHQSPLPLALLLRMAGVPRVTGLSIDYPGALLDVRVTDLGDVHEVERALAIAAAAGFELPDGDDGRLALRSPVRHLRAVATGMVAVVHPGASVPARTLSATRWIDVVDLLVDAGVHVVITGSSAEGDLVERVAGGERDGVTRVVGYDLLALARQIAGASVFVGGNTGPAHLAAAVGTPVVSVFAPTVPVVRWRPWAVPHVVLGDQGLPCAGCRAHQCPESGHPCLSAVTPDAVAAAAIGLAQHQVAPVVVPSVAPVSESDAHEGRDVGAGRP
jgi:ADP-heptose:LPS heptosyltransferase